MAMTSGAADPAAQGVVRTVLIKQERLLDAQIAQLGRQRWRDAVFATLAASILVAGIAFVWSAWRADGIVVAPFAVPPALAQQGVTGAVIAAQMLDRLTAMQAETLSLRPASSYSDDWSGNIKVALPYAGISVGELRTYLVNWLGRQRTLSGEVIALPDGQLAVTVRISGAPGRRYEDARLDALVQKAAEGVYEQTQAYRYATWLANSAARPDKAKRIYQALSRAFDPVERIWGFTGLGIDARDVGQSIAFNRKALSIDPDFLPAVTNLAYAEWAIGHLEVACRDMRRSIPLTEKWRGRLTANRLASDLIDSKASVAACTGDFATSGKLKRQFSETEGGFYTSQVQAPLTLAFAYADLHDVGAAQAAIRDGGLDDPAKLKTVLDALGSAQDPQVALAYAERDWPRVRDNLARVAKALESEKPGLQVIDSNAVVRTALAEALARTGRHAEAAALLGSTPIDSDTGVRVRALAAAFAGRSAEADRWFAMLARRTPSLPMAHEAWAEAKLFRRDYPGAIREAAAAHALGPRWADPLKHWGDALAAQGKWTEARIKYAEALERAPNWTAARNARDRAAYRLLG